MSHNEEHYHEDLSRTYFIDMADSTYQLQPMEAMAIPPDPTPFISSTYLTMSEISLDQPLLAPEAEGGDLSDSTIPEVTFDQPLLAPEAEGGDLSDSTIPEVTFDQPLLAPEAEGGDPAVSTMPVVTLDQPLLAPEAEGGVQLPASSQTSREKAVPSTSCGRKSRKRSNENKEGKKKIPKYMQDENYPNLTRQESNSIKNSKNAKKNRDKTERKIQELEQRVDDVEEVNNQLVKENNQQIEQNNQMMKEINMLHSKIRNQNQIIQWYQRREDKMKKLMNSPPNSGMLQ
ncbi:uncharacterized protein LOC123510425 [Portunus trituberculatus]|uniref:uncharacterized protein LOC123510425 n=1 Tax=Portunus trituberculatus TaxID=210409 RepID=UPI001E1CB37B|nr:uncharacterized protein LOC123510425 [Portunus trituberculatus]